MSSLSTQRQNNGTSPFDCNISSLFLGSLLGGRKRKGWATSEIRDLFQSLVGGSRRSGRWSLSMKPLCPPPLLGLAPLLHFQASSPGTRTLPAAGSGRRSRQGAEGARGGGGSAARGTPASLVPQPPPLGGAGSRREEAQPRPGARPGRSEGLAGASRRLQKRHLRSPASAVRPARPPRSRRRAGTAPPAGGL